MSKGQLGKHRRRRPLIGLLRKAQMSIFPLISIASGSTPSKRCANAAVFSDKMSMRCMHNTAECSI